MTAAVIALRNRSSQKRSAKAGAENSFAFSKTTIRKTIEHAGDATGLEFRDEGCRGLVLRKQTRDWVFGIKRKINGKVRRATIERWTGHNDIAAVRADAERIMSDMKAGNHMPSKAKAAISARTQSKTSALAELAQMTIQDAIDLHAQVNPQLRVSTLNSYRYSVIDLTEGRTVQIADITPHLMRDAYARVERAKSSATANRMLRSVSALWRTWAEEHPEGQEPTRNPVSAVSGKRRGVVKRVAPRDNALQPFERLPWYLAAAGRGTVAGNALAFLFLTGLRKNEVLSIRWSEIDLVKMQLVIAGERMKSGTALARPITPQMYLILKRQKDRQSDGDIPWVFPGSTGAGPCCDVRKTLQTLNKLHLSENRSITIHDLRRTYLAAAALAGIPDVASKMLVGHSVTDITAAYQTALRSELPILAAKIEAELLGEPI